MLKQRVPDIEFGRFVFGEIKELFDENRIFINPSYQRGDIWKHSQKIELIRSIENRYSIGVLVLFINDRGQYEVLDGQQRLLALLKYMDGTLDLKNSNITPYLNLNKRDKIELDAYCVYFLKLKSHHSESKEEDIVQTFLRLQEGSPLNRAEKISAYRGEFKNAFKKASEEKKLFQLLTGDKRFRFRLLAAEMLLLELEGDIKNKIFPSLELQNFIDVIGKYKKNLPKSKLKFYQGNLDLLYRSLNYLLTALKPREILSFYLLTSYLRKHKAGNKNLANEISAFAKDFLKILNSFGIYDEKAPSGLSEDIFKKYRSYKFEAKVMTTSESIKKRFEIILSEFNRLKPFIEKDPMRYYDEDQRRTLFFRQEGTCKECRKPMHFRESSGDHMILHSDGGNTSDLDNAQLLHKKCHEVVEKKRLENKKDLKYYKK